MKIKRNIWFLLRLWFNKIKPFSLGPYKYIMSEDVIPTMIYKKLPWHPCTSTDTHFLPNRIERIGYNEVMLYLHKPLVPHVVSCGGEPITLNYSGGCLTSVEKFNDELIGKFYNYGKFFYYVEMDDDPNVVCAVWFLTKTHLDKLKFSNEEVGSILPEIDWPESSVENSPGKIMMSIHDGVLYRNVGYTLHNNGFYSKKMLKGYYWIDWTPEALIFGYEGHEVGRVTTDVPNEPIYPIIWIAKGKWGGEMEKKISTMKVKDFKYLAY